MPCQNAEEYPAPKGRSPLKNTSKLPGTGSFMCFLILLIQSSVYFCLEPMSCGVCDAKTPGYDAISRWFDVKTPGFDAISPEHDAISRAIFCADNKMRQGCPSMLICGPAARRFGGPSGSLAGFRGPMEALPRTPWHLCRAFDRAMNCSLQNCFGSLRGGCACLQCMRVS